MTTHPITPPSTTRPPDDPRLALLRALNTPPYDTAAGKVGASLTEAAQLIDDHRAAVARELSQEEAWASGATRVPEEIVGEVYEVTNDGRPTGWPKFFDRTVEVWEETGERYDGDVVMMPGSGWVPMLRRDVQAFWGPLVAEEAYDEFVSAVNRRQALAYAAAQEATDG